MRNYFLLYDEAASVNYKHLLKLYGIAEYNKKNRLYDTITYNTLDELTQRINDKYGKCISKSTDFTAEQFLAACGLCSTSGSNKQKISKYNSILSSAGLISIERKRDNNGHLRNTYRIPLL